MRMKKNRHRNKKRNRKDCRVYALRDPKDNKFYYVGQTRGSLGKRKFFHYKKLYADKWEGNHLSPAQKWLDGLLREDRRVEICLLEENATWDVTEVVFIDRLRAEGHPLLNAVGVVTSKPVPRSSVDGTAKLTVSQVLTRLRAYQLNPISASVPQILSDSIHIIEQLRKVVAHLGHIGDICTFEELGEICDGCACFRCGAPSVDKTDTNAILVI